MIIVSPLYQTLTSVQRILRSVASTLSVTTSPGPSAVNVKMAISSAMMGIPALVSDVAKYSYIAHKPHLVVGMYRFRHKHAIRTCNNMSSRSIQTR